MLLEAGRRIGPFEIVELLGQGGMGEVYRARDTRLHRDVALKVLPDRYASDEQRLARFRREALVLASLVHPHIATLFGIEESVTETALVMELVDGETLDDRIARYRDPSRGRGLPLDDVLRLAGEIADALEAAHRRGVIHRDLKPANIKVNVADSVKVLDFGLASILAPDAHSDVTGETITEARPQTVLGTPAYMSPEQARGESTDQRADVWAFGCVLYEMLTGRRAFSGQSTVDVLARVLEREPDLNVVPPDTPPAIRRLLRRTLSKNPRARLRDMGDARLEINDALARIEDAPPDRPAVMPARVKMLYAAAALAVGAMAGFFVSEWLRSRAAPRAISRFEIAVASQTFASGVWPAGRGIAISRDGSRVVLPSDRGFVIRYRDKVSAEPIEIGPAGEALLPFFSPDGRWIGYTADSALKKVAVSGGAPVELAKVATIATGTWSGDQIIYADATGLYRVSQDGGTPERLPVNLAPIEQVAFPHVIPGGQSILFTVMPTRTNTIDSASQSRRARIDALDLRSGRQTTILRGGGRPVYAPTGHLLFALDGTLHAVLFDARRLEIGGEPIELFTDMGSSAFAVSDEGTLAYVARGASERGELVWVDRRGREESLGAPLHPYAYPRLSPDGKYVALDVAGVDRDIWVWDISRRVFERFTDDPAEEMLPAWSLDGQHLVFGSSRVGGVANVFWQQSDRRGEPERLWESERLQQPMIFAPDGRLLVSEAVPGRGRDVLALSFDAPRRIERILDSDATEGWTEVSADGRWIAYDSNQSGQFEIYVRPYPRIGEGRWRVSTAGGREPSWSRDGKELFYRDFSGALYVVPIRIGPTFIFGPPVKLLDGSRYRGGGPTLGGRTYDVDRDGSRFLMIKRVSPTSGATSIVITENWFQELHARLPLR
jgi:eukaryotic-like serine/threonine-protein kinase